MKDRCLNELSKDYGSYGGRGITVCAEWLDFNGFLNDMGERPSLDHSIERVDVNGPYCKQNCTWILKGEQAFNRRTTRRYEYNGKMRTIGEIVGKPSTDPVWQRMYYLLHKKQLSVVEALTEL